MINEGTPSDIKRDFSRFGSSREAHQDPIAELVELFSRLPGVGERSALRHVFFILEKRPEYARALGKNLVELHSLVHKCEICGNYGAQSRCKICLDSRRDNALLCIVGRVPELIAIERSGSFRGRYHVLHGLLAPLDGFSPDELPLDPLMRRIKEEGVKEIIVATPLSVDGEATALYVAQTARKLGVRISRIASGIPHGGELEYTDQVTLGRAFEARHDL
jgi:recombination protein RecR